MMYSRLKLARNLLKDDGIIVIHIDENEYSNLEKILKEIFGEQNNLGTLVWDKRNPKGDAYGIANQHELIVFFSKDNVLFRETNNLKKEKENARIILEKAKALIYAEGNININVRKAFKDWMSKQQFNGGELAYNQIDDNGRVFQAVSMAWPNNKKAPDDYFIPLIHPETGKPCPVPEKGWRNPSKTMKKLLDKDLVVFGVDETTQPRRKYLLEENITENLSSLLYYGGSDDKFLKSIGVFFDNPKPLYVAQRIINSIDSKDEIIMDFFGGSGTTANAVIELNVKDGGARKFILVQLDSPSKYEINNSSSFETISALSKERIRRAGKKIIADNSDKQGIGNLDIGFRVLKIDSTNMKDVYYTPDALKQADMLDLASNIKEDRTAEDLLFQVMLDWGLELSLPIERKAVAGKEVFYVAGNSLVACFDELTFNVVDEIAKDHPLRFVSAEKAIHLDHDKTNIKERFKQLSRDTEVKFL